MGLSEITGGSDGKKHPIEPGRMPKPPLRPTDQRTYFPVYGKNNETSITQENENVFRRKKIIDLATSLVHGLNPQITEERAREVLQREHDIFATPLYDLRKYSKTVANELEIYGLHSAMEITKFYAENTVEVPDYVLVYKDYIPWCLNQIKKDSKKALIYITTDDKPLSYDYNTFQFPETVKRKIDGRKQDVHVQPPDVIFDDVEVEANKDLLVKNADNIIIYGALTQKKRSLIITRQGNIQLESSGTIAFMPGSSISHNTGSNDSKNSYDNVRAYLNTSGNVIQYYGTSLAVAGVKCHDYDRRGGELVYPKETMRGVRVRIECAGEFKGEEPDPNKFEIIDSNLAAREVARQTPVIQHELDLPAETGEKLKETSEINETNPYRELDTLLAKHPKYGISALSDKLTLEESFLILDDPEADEHAKIRSNIRIVTITENLRKMEDRGDSLAYVNAFKEITVLIDEQIRPYEKAQVNKENSDNDVRKRILKQLSTKRQEMIAKRDATKQ